MEIEEIEIALNTGKEVCYKNEDNKVFINSNGEIFRINKYSKTIDEVVYIDIFKKKAIRGKSENFYVKGTRSNKSLFEIIFLPSIEETPYYRELSLPAPRKPKVKPYPSAYKKTIRRRNFKRFLYSLHFLILLILALVIVILPIANSI